jgi:hypothetical protein
MDGAVQKGCCVMWIELFSQMCNILFKKFPQLKGKYECKKLS